MILEQITSFEHYLKYEKRSSTHTLKAYSNDLIQITTYLKATYEIENMNKVELVHLRSYLVHLVELKYQERAIQRKVSSVSAFCKFLIKRGFLVKNPVLNLRVPKAPKRLPTFLEQNQSQKLFETISYPEGFEGLTHQLIMELLYQTGMRRAELINLQEADTDTSRKELVVMGKRSKERAIPIGDVLNELIKEYIREKKLKIETNHGKLLTLESGKPLYDNYAYRVVKRHLGEDITTLKKRSPHVLRHTFATQLSNNGADISAIKDLLGHGSLAATQIYTHSNIEHLKEVYQKAHPKATEKE